MSTVRKPSACSLAWLAMVALVLFGAPSQGRPASRRTDQDTTLSKLAAGLAPQELATSSGQRGTAAQQLFKSADILGSPDKVRTEAPALLTCGSGSLAARTRGEWPRPHLVGTVELRI